MSIIYALPGLFAIIWALIIFSRKESVLTHFLFGSSMAILGVALLLYSLYFFPLLKDVFLLDEIFGLVSLFVPSLYLFSLSTLVYPSRKSKSFLICFLIPVVFAFMDVFGSLMTSQASKDIFISSTALNAFRSMPSDSSVGLSYLYIVENYLWAALFIVSVLTVVLFAPIALKQYNRILEEYYAAKIQSGYFYFRSMIFSSIATIALMVVMFAIPLEQRLSGVVAYSIPLLSLVVVNLFGYMTCKLKYSADSLNLLINSAPHTDSDEFSVSESKSTTSFESSLKKLFDQDKIFLSPDLTLDSLAKLLGTNRTYLSAYIHKSKNQNFSCFVNDYRIAYAKNLMLENADNLKLSEVSVASGFSSVSSFLTHFSRVTGMTPTVWKKTVL